MPKRDYFRYRKVVKRTAAAYDEVESYAAPEGFESHIESFAVLNETSDGNTVRIFVEDNGIFYPVTTMLALLTSNPRMYEGNEIVMSGKEVLSLRLSGGVAGDTIAVVFAGYLWKDS